MPEFQKAAEKGMQALSPEIRTSIEGRFADTSSITMNVADKMRDMGVPFPQALISAVREKDPKLAGDIEGKLKAQAPEKKLEAPKPGASASNIVPVKSEESGGVKVSRSVSAEVGASPSGASAKAAVELEILGQSFTLNLGGGVVGTKGEGVDLSGKAELCIGDNVYMEVYRDPLTQVSVAATGGISKDVGGGFYLGAGVEGGLDTSGGKYVTIYPTVSFESERFKFELSPLATVVPETALGVNVSAELSITQNVSLTVGGYAYDVTSPTFTAMGGIKVGL